MPAGLMSASRAGAPEEEALAAAAREGDGPADALVRSLGRSVWAVNRLLEGVRSNDEPLPPAVPTGARPLLVPELPSWADAHRLRRAQAFAQAHLLPVTTALFCAALPTSYLSARGARVLEATGRLRREPDRRINETARFVLEVLAPGSFDAGGRARVVVGKVRLVHSAVRVLLGPGEDGVVPINQEDMAGTVLLFSTVVLKALARLGVTVDVRDREDFVHLWCAVGAMLGVREELLPADAASAERMLARYRERHLTPSEEGRRLMAVLLQGMERHMALPGFTSGPRALLHLLLGTETAEALGVPRATRALDGQVLAWCVRSLAPALARPLLESVTAVKLGGVPVSFAMPTRLRRTDSPRDA